MLSHKDSEAIASALPAAFTKSRSAVRVIYTGSNQDRLAELFSRSRAALYEGASILSFPALGDDFLQFVSEHVHKSFRRRIRIPELAAAYERFQHRPRALIDLVFLYVSSDKPSFKDVLNARIESLLTSDLFQPILEQVTPLQKQICERLAAGADVSSIEARAAYSKALLRKSISPGSISDALRSLVTLHILTKPAGSHGRYSFDDPMFREWLHRLKWP